MVRCIYIFFFQPSEKIVGSMEDSVELDIAAGVRQRCVLSLRFSCAILEWRLSKWRAQCSGVGFIFEDGGGSLLDLRFADAVLISAKSYAEIGWWQLARCISIRVHSTLGGCRAMGQTSPNRQEGLNGAQEFAEFDVQVAKVVFVDFAVATCRTCNRCNHSVKIS